MRISVRHIQQTLANDFGIPVEMMTHPCKKREFAVPRMIAFKLARELTPLSLLRLAKLFERDHTTIIAGIRSADRYISNDRSLALKTEARKLLFQCTPQVALATDSIVAPPAPSYDHTPWCPLEYRDDYRNLRKKCFSAAEARPMIQEMMRVDAARARAAA